MSTLPLARLAGVTDTVPTGRVPWRIVRSAGSKVVDILDADDNVVIIFAAPEIAGRIIAAVNMVECAYRKVENQS